MAGVTNYPFRSLCRRFGAGLYVSEMITARPLVEGNQKTLRIADFGAEESPRSLQLYGVDPYYVGEATKRLVGEGRVDHIDMNFGCPVRKVTSKGGGAAIPVKPKLLAAIVRACVQNGGAVPVTIKFRMGIHDELLTFLDAGRVGEAEGCRAVGLHARTAAQLYDGEARWSAIGELKQAVRSIPVLGNGDIWEAEDAPAHDAQHRMRRRDRGPRLPRTALAVSRLGERIRRSRAGKSTAAGRHRRDHVGARHAAQRLVRREPWRCARFAATRPGTPRGFRGSAELRQRLMQIASLSDLRLALANVDGSQPFRLRPCACRVARDRAPRP